jgi:hypothetical protein
MTAKALVLQSQLTTKSQGTILIENTYGNMDQYGLPDKMVFTVDIEKFKIPKAVATDLNKSSTEKGTTKDDKKGKITLTFRNYVINKGVNEEMIK